MSHENATEKTSDFRRRTSAESGGRRLRWPRGWRVARSLKSEVGGLENVQGLSPRRLFLTQSRRGAEDAEVCLKKRTGKVPAGLISIENVLSAPLPSPDGSPVPIPVGRSGEDFSFGFSTKYHDREVGLISYQLRSYSPRLGRWLNRDPIEERGGANVYRFCENNPTHFFDLFGMRIRSGVKSSRCSVSDIDAAAREVLVLAVKAMNADPKESRVEHYGNLCCACIAGRYKVFRLSLRL